MESVSKLGVATRARGLLLGLLGMQGFHELEHVVQVVQRYVLGVPNGNGIAGSVADLEPVHFAYNTIYFALLVYAVIVFLPLRYTRQVIAWRLLVLALSLQTWHEFDHILKMIQYLQLHVNGTGGVFGLGPGALVPLFSLPWLHLAYNTASFLPALIAGILLRRSPDGK